MWLVPLIAVLLGVPAQAPATPDPSVSTSVPWAPHDHSLHEDIVWGPIAGVFFAVACISQKVIEKLPEKYFEWKTRSATGVGSTLGCRHFRSPK